MKSVINDDENAAKWLELIRKFNAMVDKQPEIKTVKDALMALRTEASNCAILNSRQREAITARVDNYLKGDYGKAKTALVTESAKK